MSAVIQTGKFVLTSTQNGIRVYLKTLENSHEWTSNIKEANYFESEKLAVMFKYANDVGECSIIELVNKK